jgi:O-antigen/teichoic acid export membrane protein
MGSRVGATSMSMGRNIVLTITRQSVAVVMRLVFMVIVARTLGPAGNGQYALAVLVPILLTNILNLGIPAANAYYIARGSLGFIKALRLNITLWLALVAIGAIGAAAVLRFSGQVLPSITPLLLVIGSLLYPITLASTFAAGLLQAVQDFRTANVALLIAPVLSLLLLAGCCLGLGTAGTTLQVKDVLMIQVIAEFAALTYFAVALRRHARSATLAGSHDTTLKQLLTFGGVIHFGNTLMQLNYRTDMFLVNAFLGPSATGVYFIAVRIAEQVWIGSQSITTVMLPTLAARPNAEFEPDDTAPQSIRLALYAGIIVGAVLVFIVRPALGWLFGPAYHDAANVMVALLPGVLLLNAARVACVAMTARGRPELNVIVAMAVFAVNVLLNLVLIPRLGTAGAAHATSASYCVGSLIALWLLSRIAQKSFGQLLAPTRRDVALVVAAFARLRGRPAR